jgi:endonuclease YncB( thermonuclease family)
MIGRSLLAFIVVVVACLISLATTTRRTGYERGQAERGEIVVGRVVAIADGDTLTVLDRNDRQHRIRLYGIDAPEKAQAFGAQSKKNLSGKVFGATVRVQVVDVDRYKREVGRIYLGDRFINLEQVRAGYAWRYAEFDRNHEFDRAEAEARRYRRGLWSAAHPTPPWEFRHARRDEGEGR